MQATLNRLGRLCSDIDPFIANITAMKRKRELDMGKQVRKREKGNDAVIF